MEAVGRQWQINPPGPLEGAEGVRLRGPVEIAQRTSIAVKVVLGLLMIRHDDPDRVQRRRKKFRIRQGFVLASSVAEIGRHHPTLARTEMPREPITPAVQGPTWPTADR